MAELTENPSSTLSSNTSIPHLRRARVACKACNARRVKCDAGDGQPCWQCRTRQIPCELVESRRGKYARKKRGVPRIQPGSRQPQRVRDPSAGREVQTPPQNPPPDATHGSIPGESSALSYVVELFYRPKGGITEPLKVHYPIPASITDRTGPSFGDRVKEPVSLHEALAMPAREVADQLVHTFFSIIHPAYPVIDRENFTRLYFQGQASPLVLQTIFLLGFTIGTDSLVHAAGYSDRATARKTHYLRAKALYDADYENDLMNIVATLLLLGFWWAGPEDQKDTCYWVGCAVTVAQSLGLHRSASQSLTSQRMRSLRRRIWWSIYTRDRHTAAAFCRPCRIRDEDCDIEPLTEDDFNFDNGYDQRIIPVQKNYHIYYVIEMSKLAEILGDIVVGELSPRRTPLGKFETETLADRLTQWESQLPDQLRSKPLDESLTAPFWANMLQMSYQNCVILLFRPKAIENLSSAEAERDIRARTAADSITRLAEDLLTTGTINSGLIHLVPALFSALTIHTIGICRKDPIRRQLAENKSRQCMLALSVLAKSWPVRIWISKTFVNLMRILTGQGSATGGSIVHVSSSIASSRNNNLVPSGHSGLPGLQHATSTQNIGNTFASNSYEPSTQSTRTNGSQAGDLHTYDCFPQAADRLVYDSLWAGYLDNTFDTDMLLHNSIGTRQYGPFEGSTAAGEPDAAEF